MDKSPQMLRIEAVANRLNLSQKSIRRYIHSGKLKSNKIGGVHRIEESDLQDFIKSSTFETAPVEETKPAKSKSKKTDKINWVDISDDWDNPKETKF